MNAEDGIRSLWCMFCKHDPESCGHYGRIEDQFNGFCIYAEEKESEEDEA